jgi:hypothetical protein
MIRARKNRSGEEAVKNQSKRTMKRPILNRALSKSAWQRSFQLPHGNPASHSAPVKSEISNVKFQFSTASPAISDFNCQISNVPRPQKHQRPPHNSGRAGTLSALTVPLQKRKYHKLALYVNTFL